MAPSLDQCFSDSYAQARGRFIDACRKLGLPVQSYRNPNNGPSGEELCTDVARIGRADAPRAIVIESGTHGVEGYAGSAIQIGYLREPGAGAAPHDLAIYLVHALNPYGFAWTRRVNEDNVDLNRNFVDHERGAWPRNEGYAALADAMVPREWNDAALATAEAKFKDYAARHGEAQLNVTLKSGQHTHPKGVFFGGRSPTWSSRTVKQICADHLADAQRAALIDIHTGLGPSGYGECLTPCSPESPEGRRATAWYGDVRHTMDKSSGYSGSVGTVVNGYMNGAPAAEWTCIGLEFGTYPPPHMRMKLRAEAWLHAYGDAKHPDAARIRAELRDAFYPATPEWNQKVLARGLDVIRMGVAGLTR